MSQSYEKLGAFYLGRVFDPELGEPKPEYLLYDSKDLTTHAVCVGMTGSGKTGLCLSLIEEAALDGIPVLAIDPKGDLGNLLLTFPELRPEDFAPWIDPGEAVRKGLEPAAYAKKVADLWRNGLAQWDQDGERIGRFRDACDLSIYTPGSNSGLPLTVLRSLTAPPQELRDDPDAFGERVLSAVSGLLAMLDIDADPVRSREHILLSNIVGAAWQAGEDLEIGELIRAIQDPPFDKVGFFDLESFFPSKQRLAFAMQINNLLASPSFAAWMQGEALEIPRLLWTEHGKPRISIISIAHLSEEQRMFFVTILLNELVAWMRTQPGTTSLRAMLYMDEVFGYFPPTANPPSKRPMLTLLKQARAYGVGCVLATQNPVDLDYKGLSNTGTWFLGRLQTERDKARVLEGLEGASSAAGASFDRGRMEATLAGLGSRVFLMNNVHDDEPVLFHTRWAMSYLRGPLTRQHIQTLMKEKRAAASASAGAARGQAAPKQASVKKSEAQRPVVHPDIDEGVLPRTKALCRGDRLIYRPGLLGSARLHFISTRDHVDEWQEVCLLARLDEDNAHDPWDGAEPLASEPSLDEEADSAGSYAELPSAASKKTSYTKWKTRLKDHLYRERRVQVWRCKELKQISEPGEGEREFRARLTQHARERRDGAVEKLRTRFGAKLQRIQDRIRTQEGRVERERAQYARQKQSTVVSIGTTILGALFGRKAVSATTVRRAGASARRASRAREEKADIARAEDKLEDLQRQLADLEMEFEAARSEARQLGDVEALDIEAKNLAPRKSDIEIERVALVWMPWRVPADGAADSLYR